MNCLKWSLCVGLLFCAGLLQAQSGTQLLRRAKAETDPAQQVRLLTQAVKKAPNLAAAWHSRADAYLALGKHKQAVADYTRALALTPKDPFRYYARALAYMQEHKYSLALPDLSKAISFKKDYPDFYLNRARCAKALGQYTLAVADYKKYLSRRKQTPAVAQELAESYIYAYKYEQAEKPLQWLIRQEPSAPQSYYLLGRIRHNQGRLDEAVSYYSKAINRAEDFAPAYRYRAAAFKDMGESEAAAEDYSKLVELTPEPIFYNRRGLVYEEMHQWDKALADYTKTIELSPKWPIAYNNRGYVYLKQKKYAAARADFETAIKLDDTLPTPYINLAGLYWLQKKDRRNVYRHLEKALKRNFKDFDSLYDEDRKGWMFQGINKTAEFRAVMYQ